MPTHAGIQLRASDQGPLV